MSKETVSVNRSLLQLPFTSILIPHRTRYLRGSPVVKTRGYVPRIFQPIPSLDQENHHARPTKTPHHFRIRQCQHLLYYRLQQPTIIPFRETMVCHMSRQSRRPQQWPATSTLRPLRPHLTPRPRTQINFFPGPLYLLPLAPRYRMGPDYTRQPDSTWSVCSHEWAIERTQRQC